MLVLREGYTPTLSLRDTQRAIKLVKDTFERSLASALKLERISAPLFVEKSSGLNDDLNGVERAVSFDIKDMQGSEAVIVHSLAKWKRCALSAYGFEPGEGLYTDMNAIRRDEQMDNLHSIYVDQWDWEKVITREQRSTEYLMSAAQAIAGVFTRTLELTRASFPAVTTQLEPKVFFISAQELADMYPALTPKEREREITRKHKTVFITCIGGVLKDGQAHDGRAPDYDDWQLNGDLLYWNEVLGDAFEVSSMGIRVDAGSMDRQLKLSGHDERRVYPYHKGVLNDTLPLTIGGGIGQSRVCMLLLGKLHIGEVQASLWPQSMRSECAAKGVQLL